MAGSYASTESDVSPLVQARLEGLKALAEHVDEPILIFNPRMELVYVNPSADKIAKDCPLGSTLATRPSHLSASNQSPCDPCTATYLFQANVQDPGNPSGSVSSVALPETCPMLRAVAVKGETGITHFAVLMGDRGSESVVVAQKEQGCSGLPPRQERAVGEVPQRTIIGESEPIQRLRETIQLVAVSEATVLIQGESGTGKELVAKTIHALSHRRARPFVVVECSALPETLLESELFGHMRGAFTGAVVDRKGLFEEAEGGTIFLDEIADTTPGFQARLLRVLQEGEIKPVGSNRSIQVDVRVISAGNQSLEELVKAKRFRGDLYYRLAVLPLTVPPLRERPEDIVLLAKHFLDISTGQHGRPALALHPDALEALTHYAWPGNVRELGNLIERAVVTCRHSTIHVSDLFGSKLLEGTKGTEGELRAVSKAARRVAERDRILEALSQANGDKTRAARLLKISRSNLYNKLRLYHIL
jgi:two-component system response regulator HydG